MKLACLLVAATGLIGQEPSPTVRVGSKTFTESVILGEIAGSCSRMPASPPATSASWEGRRSSSTRLEADELDIYPEYTGTITGEILAGKNIRGEEALRAALAERGVGMSRPLGFNDTYAIGMREDVAARLGIRTLSDLRGHPELKFGFSNEFMERADGWPGLRDRYGLPQRDVRGLDHDLAYRALASGEIDATELYSTDAEIRAYHLRVLDDDQKFFPSYECVWLYRTDLPSRAPRRCAALARLEGRITATEMAMMNARAKIDRVSEDRVAAEFVAEKFGIETDVRGRGQARAGCCAGWWNTSRWWASRWRRRSWWRSRWGSSPRTRPRLGSVILASAGVVQTIPSLALLVFMIPWLGIGAAPALAALFLYSLLPIVRNTATGLRDIAPSLRESAEALGLPPFARLLQIELPLSSRAILAGIKTAAVINVGTATIGALIGAGGFGQPIVSGFRRDDVPMILFEGRDPRGLAGAGRAGAVRPRRAVPRAAGIADLINRRSGTGRRNTRCRRSTRSRARSRRGRSAGRSAPGCTCRNPRCGWALRRRTSTIVPATRTPLHPQAHERELDAFLLARVIGPVAKGVEVEIPVQLAVDPRQQVEVERRADAAAIVVRGPDDRLVLVEVEADQQAASRSDQPGDRAQQPQCGRRSEVPDRRAREVDHPTRRVGPGLRQVEIAGEVVADRDDLERGKAAG